MMTMTSPFVEFAQQSSSSYNGNRSDLLMIIDAININRTVGMMFNDPCVATDNATIGAVIDERTLLLAGGSRHTVLKVMRHGFPQHVCMTIDSP
jgi:hypothetical protein